MQQNKKKRSSGIRKKYISSVYYIRVFRINRATNVLDSCIISSAEIFTHALFIMASCMMKMVVRVGNTHNSDLLGLIQFVER